MTKKVSVKQIGGNGVVYNGSDEPVIIDIVNNKWASRLNGEQYLAVVDGKFFNGDDNQDILEVGDDNQFIINEWVGHNFVHRITLEPGASIVVNHDSIGDENGNDLTPGVDVHYRLSEPRIGANQKGINIYELTIVKNRKIIAINL